MLRRWQRFSLRWRLMVIGTAGLAAGLAAGGALLVLVMSTWLLGSLDSNAEQTARDVTRLVEDGRLPEQVPVAGLQYVQVVDGQSRVRAGSPGVDRLVPMLQPAELERALAGDKLEVDGARFGLDGDLRVLAVPASAGTERLAVVVAAPLADAREGPRLLRFTLLLAFPVLVLLLAVVAWWVIGLTLRPVEALRVGAEHITGRDGSRLAGTRLAGSRPRDGEPGGGARDGGTSGREPGREPGEGLRGGERGGGGRLPVPAGADEIQRLAVTLNGMLDRLDAARQRQRQFVADAAHELRNPLAAMRTQLEVARRHPAGTDWSALVDDVLIDTERLSRLADDLLLLARADEATERRSRPEPVALGPLLRRVAARYRDARVPVLVTDPTSTPADELHAWMDEEELHRAITNLVDNAVRHARSAVEVSAAPAAAIDGDRVLVAVTDDGEGIAEADRKRVFGRFTRLDAARGGHDGGAGLGLPIVAELVRRHGGAVRLGDAGPGLRVELLVPRPPRLSPQPDGGPPDRGPSDAGPLDRGPPDAGQSSWERSGGGKPGGGQPERGQSVRGQPAREQPDRTPGAAPGPAGI